MMMIMIRSKKTVPFIIKSKGSRIVIVKAKGSLHLQLSLVGDDKRERERENKTYSIEK